MKDFSDALTPEEKDVLKKNLLCFVKRVSRSGYDLPGEAFLVLPVVVDRLTGAEK